MRLHALNVMGRIGGGERISDAEHAEDERAGKDERQADLTAPAGPIDAVERLADLVRVAEAGDPLAGRVVGYPAGCFQFPARFLIVRPQFARDDVAPTPRGSYLAAYLIDELFHDYASLQPLRSEPVTKPTAWTKVSHSTSLSESARRPLPVSE